MSLPVLGAGGCRRPSGNSPSGGDAPPYSSSPSSLCAPSTPRGRIWPLGHQEATQTHARPDGSGEGALAPHSRSGCAPRGLGRSGPAGGRWSWAFRAAQVVGGSAWQVSQRSPEAGHAVLTRPCVGAVGWVVAVQRVPARPACLEAPDRSRLQGEAKHPGGRCGLGAAKRQCGARAPRWSGAGRTAAT